MRVGFDTIVSATQDGVLAGSILLMSALGIANVFARNFLGESLASADELSQALLVVLTFAGIAVGARHARHIRMSALVDALPLALRKPLWCTAAAGTAAALGALAFFAFDYVRQVAASGRVTPALQLPVVAIYAVAPLGLLAGAIEYALILRRNLRTPGIHFERVDSAEVPPA